MTTTVSPFNRLTKHFTSAALRLATKIISRNKDGSTTADFSPMLREDDLPTFTRSPQHRPIVDFIPTQPLAERRPMECSVSFRVNKDHTIRAAGYITDITTTHYKVLSYPHNTEEPKNHEWFPISWAAVTRWA